ncbi:MAG TPA: hypothetical protein VJK90_06535 [Acetobacteraceae bacterium]|jgi:hypothetical protein|nr:hypothetical protein [Acetobacteraceae bacterium]
MENGDPAGFNAAITERRELRFSPGALQAMIGWSLGAASSHGLPPSSPDEVKLHPEENRIDLVYGRAAGKRSIPLKVEGLATLLIAYCIRALIPLPRIARKEVRIGARYVSLVFHVEHSQAPTPAVIESDVVRQGPVRQWR